MSGFIDKSNYISKYMDQLVANHFWFGNVFMKRTTSVADSSLIKLHEKKINIDLKHNMPLKGKSVMTIRCWCHCQVVWTTTWSDMFSEVVTIKWNTFDWYREVKYICMQILLLLILHKYGNFYEFTNSAVYHINHTVWKKL